MCRDWSTSITWQSSWMSHDECVSARSCPQSCSEPQSERFHLIFCVWKREDGTLLKQSDQITSLCHLSVMSCRSVRHTHTHTHTHTNTHTHTHTHTHSKSVCADTHKLKCACVHCLEAAHLAVELQMGCSHQSSQQDVWLSRCFHHGQVGAAASPCYPGCETSEEIEMCARNSLPLQIIFGKY